MKLRMNIFPMLVMVFILAGFAFIMVISMFMMLSFMMFTFS